jgi:hypothetical protein
MCDSFVHTNKNLQGGDYGSQAPLIWMDCFIQIGLVCQRSQINRLWANNTPKKLFEKILRYINAQVLETKYIINLG